MAGLDQLRKCWAPHSTSQCAHAAQCVALAHWSRHCAGGAYRRGRAVGTRAPPGSSRVQVSG
eukprot:2751349-Rhodomonas_salina.2